MISKDFRFAIWLRLVPDLAKFLFVPRHIHFQKRLLLTLSKLFMPLFRKGFCSKGKEFAPTGSECFPFGADFRLLLFQKGLGE